MIEAFLITVIPVAVLLRELFEEPEYELEVSSRSCSAMISSVGSRSSHKNTCTIIRVASDTILFSSPLHE